MLPATGYWLLGTGNELLLLIITIPPELGCFSALSFFVHGFIDHVVGSLQIGGMGFLIVALNVGPARGT